MLAVLLQEAMGLSGERERSGVVLTARGVGAGDGIGPGKWGGFGVRGQQSCGHG